MGKYILKATRNSIVGVLRDTNRQGINLLIDYMDCNGFFTAPCSGQYHLAEEGGLAKHSLNVYNLMMSMYYMHNEFGIQKDYISKYVQWEEIVIVSILHDLGKMGQFGKPNYIPNMVKSRKKDEDMIQSVSKPFKTNPELLAVPHEIRSIQIATQFIQLTEEENFAILHHNGMYGDLKYQLSGKERPLQMLLHWADMWASRVIEKEA